MQKGKKKIVEESVQKGKAEKASVNCNDKLCPFHGSSPIKLHGRKFEGTVIRKFPSRIAIEFERVLYIKKYERYEKRKTKLHARLPDCLKDTIKIGDYIEIGECRPLSKIIHFVVIKKIRDKQE